MSWGECTMNKMDRYWMRKLPDSDVPQGNSELSEYSDEDTEDFITPGHEPGEQKSAVSILSKLSQYSSKEEEGCARKRKRMARDGEGHPTKRPKYSEESESGPVAGESHSPSPNFKPSESGTKNKDSDADLTEEERIYKMSSSANKSKADFMSKYTVLLTLGEGGFGKVYSGSRRSDGLPVAIKYIHAEKVAHQEVICNGTRYNVILEVMFMLRATGLKGGVNQSAAVSLLDWYSLDDWLVLVMERPTPCIDLLKHLERHGGKLCEDKAKDILRQMVDIAIEMESKGIFHRDIKPHNILIQSQSRVRLIDFGCANFSSGMFHRFCGTLKYAPPEWFSCKAYQASQTTVWQLGALFHSLLHGTYKFSTQKFMEGMVTFSPGLSEESKFLLHMCLDMDPKTRCTLQDLKEFLAER